MIRGLSTGLRTLVMCFHLNCKMAHSSAPQTMEPAQLFSQLIEAGTASPLLRFPLPVCFVVCPLSRHVLGDGMTNLGTPLPTRRSALDLKSVVRVGNI